MCRVLGVSTRGYYAWRKRPSSPRALRDRQLRAEIERIYHDSRDTYGAPRVHVELIACGRLVCGRKKVAKVMRTAGLVGRCGRRRGPKTTRRAAQEPRVPDLVMRKFTAERPNAVWTADIERHEALLDRAVVKGHRLRALAGVW
jgi:putative transposase